MYRLHGRLCGVEAYSLYFARYTPAMPVRIINCHINMGNRPTIYVMEKNMDVSDMQLFLLFSYSPKSLEE